MSKPKKQERTLWVVWTEEDVDKPVPGGEIFSSEAEAREAVEEWFQDGVNNAFIGTLTVLEKATPPTGAVWEKV